MRCSVTVLICISVILSGCVAEEATSKVSSIAEQSSPAATVEIEMIESLPYTAEFAIYTNQTKRIFTNSMYHNLSQDVYIEESNPSLVHVTRSGVTWNEFFETLPFSLTKECLVTGTKQTFCNSENGQLRFLLNGEDDSDALDQLIQENDRLEVRYEN